MAGMLQMRRSRGAFSGFLLVLLGLWGALIPFIGPYFHFAFTPDTAWTYNTARLWLEILPGAAVFLGGFFLLVATGRHIALFGAMLAAAAGAWFVLGTVLSPLWSTGSMSPGTPVGSTTLIRVMEQIGFFSGLGVVVVLVAAAAAGRIASVASGIVPVGAHARTAPVTETVPVQTRRTEDTVDDTADTERTEVIR
ncbi:MAG: hypothetical protein ACRDPY_28220 [Streptosporangiaceae bacterium]